MPSTLPGTAQAQSGLLGAQTQLYCTGAGVPIPDWADYISHPEDIPTECVDNASTPVINGTPIVTTYDPNYGAPKTKRVSLGLTRRVTQRITFNVDASYVRGVGQGASRDLNLNETARFSLGNEDNRPVYADPAQIFPTTGGYSALGVAQGHQLRLGQRGVQRAAEQDQADHLQRLRHDHQADAAEPVVHADGGAGSGRFRRRVRRRQPDRRRSERL